MKRSLLWGLMASPESQLKRQNPRGSSGTVGEVCLNNGGMPCVVVGLSLEIMPAIESKNYAKERGEAAKHGTVKLSPKPNRQHIILWMNESSERDQWNDCSRLAVHPILSISVLFELIKPINLGPFNIIFYGTSTTSCPVASQSNGCWRQGQCASLLGSWIRPDDFDRILSDSILSNEETTSGNLSRIHFVW